jgi:hypothetical protein
MVLTNCRHAWSAVLQLHFGQSVRYTPHQHAFPACRKPCFLVRFSPVLWHRRPCFNLLQGERRCLSLSATAARPSWCTTEEPATFAAPTAGRSTQQDQVKRSADNSPATTKRDDQPAILIAFIRMQKEKEKPVQTDTEYLRVLEVQERTRWVSCNVGGARPL